MKNLIFNLPDKINKSDIFTSDLFRIFEINNVLDEKFYQSSFTKNKLVVFLKSNNSFHNIEK